MDPNPIQPQSDPTNKPSNTSTTTKQKIATRTLLGVSLVLIGTGILAYAAAGWVSPSRPTAKVILPNGGETINLSQPYEIKWESTNATKASIYLYRNDRLYKTIASSVKIASLATTTTYSWLPSKTIKKLAPSDTNTPVFKIQVTARGKSFRTASDKSDGTFSILSATSPPSPTPTPSNSQTPTPSPSCSATPPSGTPPSPWWSPSPTTAHEYINAICGSGESTYQAWCAYFRQCPAAVPCGYYNGCSASSITVLSPNGGESWHPGETHRILWTPNIVNIVKIYISDSNVHGSGSTNYITPNGNPVSGLVGYYDWTIPSLNQLPSFDGNGSTNYKIRIDNADTNAVLDSSDAPFSIVAAGNPSITVTSPNGGEKWEIGKAYQIKWSGSMEAIYVFKSNQAVGAPVFTVVKHAGVADTGGVFNWTIPSDAYLTPGSYVVQIVGTYSNAIISNPSDNSDAPFSIVAASTPPSSPLSVNLTANPSSGNPPLNINLTADPSSANITGTYNYTFWWNCSNTSTNIQTVKSACGDPDGTSGNASGIKFDGINDDPKSITHSYPTAGTYTPKVIVERGSYAAEARTTVVSSSGSGSGTYSSQVAAAFRLNQEVTASAGTYGCFRDCGLGTGNNPCTIPVGQTTWFLIDPKGFTGNSFPSLRLMITDCLQNGNFRINDLNSVLLYTIDSSDNLYPGTSPNPRTIQLYANSFGPLYIPHSDDKRYLIKVVSTDRGAEYTSTLLNIYWDGH